MANSFSDDRSLPPFLQATKRRNPQQDEHAASTHCFGLAENDSRAFGFKIFYADGSVSGMFYRDITSPMKFDGNGDITISFVTFQLRITGNNLARLFHSFFNHQVVWIKELDASFFMDGNEPEIETVTIEDYGS